MKSQVPLPAVFLNESCSSGQEHMKPCSAEPWLQGLTCTGLPAGTGPSCLICVGGAGTANFPREINRKPCYLSRPTSVVERPGGSWTGSDAVCNSNNLRLLHSQPGLLPGQNPSQLHAPKMTNLLSACSASLTQLHSQSMLHTNNKEK